MNPPNPRAGLPLRLFERLKEDPQLSRWIEGELELARKQRIYLEEQRARTERLTHLAGVATQFAHDIRNVLHGLRKATAAARGMLTEEHPACDNFSALHESLHHAFVLCRQFRAYVDDVPGCVAPVDLSNIVADCIALLRTIAGEQIEFDLSLRALPQVTGRLGDLEQMLVDLVTYAAEMQTGSSRRIGIETRYEQSASPDGRSDFVVLSVISGREGFGSAERSAGGDLPELGSVRCIVADHDGTVSVLKTEDTTRFDIRLPCQG